MDDKKGIQNQTVLIRTLYSMGTEWRRRLVFVLAMMLRQWHAARHLCLNPGYGVRRYKQLVWIEVHGKETNRGNEYLGTLREYSTEFPLRIPTGAGAGKSRS